MLSSFIYASDDLSFIKFKYKKAKISLTFKNSSKDTLAIPNVFLRTYKKSEELRKEFYKLSNDTLFLIFSKKPNLASVSVSHRVENLHIDGEYNDFKMHPNSIAFCQFFIESIYKKSIINFVSFKYDNFIQIIKVDNYTNVNK